MISIGYRKLTLGDFYKILFEGEKIEIDAGALRNVEDNFAFLAEFAKGKVIYGINTGLGPMAQFKINGNRELELQYNLIRSHAAGCGAPLPDIYVKATMLARISTLIQARSGIHPDVIQILKELINREIYPYIPEHGGVGASGDLVQLAHLAVCLIGEGEVMFNGEFRPTKEVYEQEGIQPLTLHIREGLGLINGTSAMSGIGIVNVIYARQLLDWAVAASALINEVVESYDDHFSVELNRVKLHPGQMESTNKLQKILAGSHLTRKRAKDLFNGTNGETVFSKKIQEYSGTQQHLHKIPELVLQTEKVCLRACEELREEYKYIKEAKR